MPELPEVETVKNGLAPIWEGQAITSVTLNRPNLRYPFPDGFQRSLENNVLKSLWRRGKYLVADFKDTHLIMHLGMSGSFKIDDIDVEQAFQGVAPGLVFETGAHPPTDVGPPNP